LADLRDESRSPPPLAQVINYVRHPRLPPPLGTFKVLRRMAVTRDREPLLAGT